MPVHDWTQVAAGIFHDFHHEWISTIKRALNDGLLPANYYALAEHVAGGLPLPLRHGRFIQVPLKATYESAFAAVPKFWRDRLQPA